MQAGVGKGQSKNRKCCLKEVPWRGVQLLEYALIILKVEDEGDLRSCGCG